MIKTAMILAAGRGIRMQKLTDNLPKPLLKVQGVELIHHITNRIVAYGIHDIVVNTCYQGNMIKTSFKNRDDVNIRFSDEKSGLDTGGGVKKALPILIQNGGENGFFVLNGDTLWSEKSAPLMNTMAQAWNPDTMDILLAIIPIQSAYGNDKRGNYFIEQGRLRRIRPDEPTAPYCFISVQIMHPRIFHDTPDIPFSSRDLYDKAQKNGRLAHIIHDGVWFNLNTPEELTLAQDLYRK